MSNTNGHGPSKDTLKMLSQAMPGMVLELEQKRHGSIISLKPKPKPTKVCAVCGIGFDMKHVSNVLPEVGICSKCRSRLKKGWTALQSHDHYAWIPPHPKMKPYAGKICPVSAEDMQKVLDKLALQEHGSPETE